jgi:hypothetical protein
MVQMEAVAAVAVSVVVLVEVAVAVVLVAAGLFLLAEQRPMVATQAMAV